MPTRTHTRRGFTLVEIIAIAFVVLVAIALILPLIANSWRRSKDVTTRNHMRRVGEGLRTYHDVYQSFPLSGSSQKAPAKKQ